METRGQTTIDLILAAAIIIIFLSAAAAMGLF
jgi:hypothetical protein